MAASLTPAVGLPAPSRLFVEEDERRESICTFARVKDSHCERIVESRLVQLQWIRRERREEWDLHCSENVWIKTRIACYDQFKSLMICSVIE